MQTSGARLKAERERLGLTQSKIAAIGGVGKTTQIKYEKDTSSPDIPYLAAVAKAGIDIFYVITGERINDSQHTLLVDEVQLVLNVRGLNDPEQKTIKRIAELMAADKAGSATNKSD